MRVQAVRFDWSNVPCGIAPFVSESQLFITAGQEYDVHAVSIYQQVVFFLVMDDTNNPTFIPSEIFNIVKGDLPVDWKCNFFPKSGVDLVLGPEFIAHDIEAYSAMVDMEWGSVEKLLELIESKNV